MKSEIARSPLENYSAGVVEPQGKLLDESLYLTRFNNTSSSYSKSYAGARTFSSQADAKSSREGDDYLEDAFSELETPLDAVQGAASGDEIDDESDLSEGEGGADDKQNELEVVGTEIDVGEKRSPKGKGISALTKAILAAPLSSVNKALDKWVEEGNEVTQTEVSLTMLHLRKRRMFVKALQLSEWLESTKHIEFHETNYASRVDLISKLHGIFKAEEYIQKIPESCRGQSNDISGMEQIVETMKSEGVEPNIQIQASLARHYTAAGLKDKAEAILKEMEGDNITKKRWVCRVLLPIYASLGRDDEVERIWKVCESSPYVEECMAAIGAWGKLKRIEEAEAAFDKMVKKVKTPSSKHFALLLNVYANHKMLAKGKDLVRRLAESGSTVGPLTWDALVKLYVRAGEVEKADSILDKALKQKRGKPLFSSYFVILDQYAREGIYTMLRRYSLG
ncbi:UNVERIFIED_CONTAM: Pentatricopeptide repeat-containing protein, mitochondrial [Sesamum latifolium]|uniref:Pentatricopeptide repeat-containing protein, mitochondrial n=1 Tax=Sesamum latifolium TaxID=2727402 RepID=A0AAW2VFM6_9LAMI